MSGKRLFQLVGMNLRRDRRGAILSALGVAAGIAALAFFVALGRGVAEVVKTKIFPADARFVEVIPPAVSIGLFGGAKLDDAAVQRLSALPNVVGSHRKMQLRVPAVTRYDGDFFGKRMRMGLEIIAVGVDPGLVEQDVTPSIAFADPGDEGGAIPVLISSRLVEIYNRSFAKGRGLPQVSPKMLYGFEFPELRGRSFGGGKVMEGGQTLSQAAVLSGVSDRALLQGVTMPLEAARRLNERFGEDGATYSSIVLVAGTPDHVPAISQAVRKAGFEIDDTERKLAESVGAAVAIVTATLALISLLICGLATVNIALSLGASVRNRMREIGILRAVGATASDVALLIVCEAMAIGLLGGAIGAALARGAALGLDTLATRYLPEFPFKPDSFFSFPWWVLAGAVALGVVASLVGAYPPARNAARLDPARAIGG